MDKTSHFQYILRIADNCLIYGQRLSEWCGHGPVLEEDIALSNTALDYLGQATHLLKYAGEVEAAGRDEDNLAFLRDADEYRNLLITELPNGDYSYTIARQFLFSAWYLLFLEKLQQSKDTFLAGFAEKSIKEVKYHFQHAADWVLRMGDGTEESHNRIQESFHKLWEYTPEFFMVDQLDEEAIRDGIGPDCRELKLAWQEKITSIMKEATLEIPADAWGQRGGRQGKHTEYLGFILSDMQYLQRTIPNARW